MRDLGRKRRRIEVEWNHFERYDRQREAIDDSLIEVAREGAPPNVGEMLIAEADAFVAGGGLDCPIRSAASLPHVCRTRKT
jgi:hypothetical protein